MRRTPWGVLIDADDERRCTDRRQRVAVVVEQHGVAQLHRRIGARDAVDILNVGDDACADFVVCAVVAGDTATRLLLLLGRAAHIDVGVRIRSHHLRDLVVEHLAEAERADDERDAERDRDDRHDEATEMRLGIP